MDESNSYLIVFVLKTIVILAGLGVVIYGIVRKKVKLIVLGVFVSLLPTLVEFFSSKLL